MVGAHVFAVLVCERADTLTDPVRVWRQGVLARLHLLNDLLSPIVGISAACDGRLTGGARGANAEGCDCEADGALAGHHRQRLGKNRHM